MYLIKFFKSVVLSLLLVILVTGCYDKATNNKQIDINKTAATSHMSKVTIGGAFYSHKNESGGHTSGRGTCPNPDGSDNPDPEEFQAVADQILISGTGEPGATIKVTDTYKGSPTDLCSATVMTGGLWTCGLQNVSGDGQHVLTAEQKIDDKLNSTDKVNYKVNKDEDNDDKNPLNKGGDGTDGHGGGTDCNRGGGEGTPEVGSLPYQLLPLAGDGALISSVLGAAAGGAGAAAGAAGSLAAAAVELGPEALSALAAAGVPFMAAFSLLHGGNVLSTIKSTFNVGSKILSFTFNQLIASGIKSLVPGNDYSIEISVYKNASDYPNNPWMHKTTPLSIPPESGLPTAPVQSGNPVSTRLSIKTPKVSEALPYSNTLTVSGYDEPGAKVTLSAPSTLDGVPETYLLCEATTDDYKRWSCNVTPSAYELIGPVTLTAKDDKGQQVSVSYVSSIANLNINSPYPTQRIITPIYQITGTGESNGLVQVTDENNKQVCKPNISKSGDWNCSGIAAVPGQHTIYAITQVTSSTGDILTAGNKASVSFSVATGATNSLSITSPPDGTWVVSSPYFIQGTATPNESIVVTGIPGGVICNTYSDIESGLWQCGPYKSTSNQDVTITATTNYDQVSSTYHLRPYFTIDSPTENQVFDINTKDYYVTGNAPRGSLVVLYGFGYLPDCHVVATNGKWSCGPYHLELGAHRILASNFKDSDDEAKNINLNAPILRRFSIHYPFSVSSPVTGGAYDGSVTPYGAAQIGSSVSYIFDGVESGTAQVDPSSGGWSGAKHLLAKGTHTFVATQNFKGDINTSPVITFSITRNDPFLFTLGATAPAEGSYIAGGTAPGKYRFSITDGTGRPGDTVRYKFGCFDTKWAMQDSDCSSDFSADGYKFGPLPIDNKGLWYMSTAYTLPAGRYTFQGAEFDSNNNQVGRSIQRNFTIYASNYLTLGNDAPSPGSYAVAPYTFNSTNGRGQAGLTVKYRLICLGTYIPQCRRPGSTAFDFGPVDITENGWSFEAPFTDMPDGYYGLEAGLFSKDGTRALDTYYMARTEFTVLDKGESEPEYTQPLYIEHPIKGSTITTTTYDINGSADPVIFGNPNSKIAVYYVDAETGDWKDKICETGIHYNNGELPADWRCEGVRSPSGNYSIKARSVNDKQVVSQQVDYKVYIDYEHALDIIQPKQDEMVHTPGNITIKGYGHPRANISLDLTNLDDGSMRSLTGDNPLTVNDLGEWSNSYGISGRVGAGDTSYSLTATQSLTGYPTYTQTVTFKVHCMMPDVGQGSC